MNKKAPTKLADRSKVIETTDEILWPDTIELLPDNYTPTKLEMALAEKNRDDITSAQSGDARAELKQKTEETKYQQRAFLIWYRQHLSGLFKAEQVDAAVAKAVGKEIGSIRRWKTQFGWAKRLENLKKEEKAEEKLLLYAKNEAVEQDSLDVVLRYLAYIRSLAAADIQPHHVSMMMKLVEFAQKNKDKMEPAGQTLNASGVSLTIQQN